MKLLKNLQNIRDKFGITKILKIVRAFFSNAQACMLKNAVRTTFTRANCANAL